MPIVKVNGINLNYKERSTSASKEHLLMIMGLKFSLLNWGDDLLNELSKSYRVIMLDNRGSGKSNPSPTSFSIADMADDTAGLLSALKISSAHVFGISMGGINSPKTTSSDWKAVITPVIVIVLFIILLIQLV